MPIATPTPTLFATGDITRDREDTNRKFAMLGNHLCGRWGGGNKLVVLTMSMTLAQRVSYSHLLFFCSTQSQCTTA